MFELAAAGLPAILVPYPHATGDHQTANARFMEQAGAAVVIPDDELDGPRLAREVAALLGAPQRMAAMANAARAVARPDAAERIADELLGLATAALMADVTSAGADLGRTSVRRGGRYRQAAMADPSMRRSPAARCTSSASAAPA